MKSIFELAENLSLVLTKLDPELGLAQPQLVSFTLKVFLLIYWKMRPLKTNSRQISRRGCSEKHKATVISTGTGIKALGH